MCILFCRPPLLGHFPHSTCPLGSSHKFSVPMSIHQTERDERPQTYTAAAPVYEAWKSRPLTGKLTHSPRMVPSATARLDTRCSLRPHRRESRDNDLWEYSFRNHHRCHTHTPTVVLAGSSVTKARWNVHRRWSTVRNPRAIRGARPAATPQKGRHSSSILRRHRCLPIAPYTLQTNDTDSDSVAAVRRVPGHPV